MELAALSTSNRPHEFPEPMSNGTVRNRLDAQRMTPSIPAWECSGDQAVSFAARGAHYKLTPVHQRGFKPRADSESARA
jgi:hypothetical protein